jgi:hypothetical protein
MDLGISLPFADMGGADEAGGFMSFAAQCDGDPALALADGARPVDRGEMAETGRHCGSFPLNIVLFL